MSVAVRATARSTRAHAGKVPTQAEFDGAFIRLLERYGGLDWQTVSAIQREQLALLVNDSPSSLRWDQDVLHDWAQARGIEMGAEAYLPNAPILYMARLLRQQGYTRVEDALREVWAVNYE